MVARQAAVCMIYRYFSQACDAWVLSQALSPLAPGLAFGFAELSFSFLARGLFPRLAVGLLHRAVGDVGFVPCGIAVMTGGHVEGSYGVTARERGCR